MTVVEQLLVWGGYLCENLVITLDPGSLAKGINFKKSKKFSGDATCPPSLLDSRAVL